ncbi:MAG TPA: serine/threonine-protein kinase [Polyangia bacterium]|nr:serine/threonine-protein kinase [Polyangia bacterium]
MTSAEAQRETAVDSILQAGQLVGERYRVEHLLGQGGMAAVWAGSNERTGKRVALKVILRSLATTSLAQGLFHSEVLAASLVNHPNVVTVFDVIEHEGMACIVMELLEGEPLGNYIARKGFLGVNEATMLLLPAMRGVAAANAQGVIHRDLKPQNIFICMEPDGRIVTTKVLDFGISVMVEQGMAPSAGPVSAMGTPAYMSPEHILGVAQIDARADVYGFGVLLYEALTGETPFPGEPSPSLFDCVLHKAPVSLTVTRPDLPPGLVRIIEKAMAKDREQRFSDVNLMVLAIEDELMSDTPAPRLPTPRAGVPLPAGNAPPSGPHAAVVENVLNKELSGQHQATRFLYEFPLEPENQASAVQTEPNDGGKAGAGEVAPAPPTGGPAPRIVLQALWGTTRSLAIGARSALRGGRRLAGAGLAVVLGFFAVWMVMRGTQHTQIVRDPTAHAAPATPVVQPAEPAVVLTSTVYPVAAMDPAITPPGPPVASTPATSEHGQSAGQGGARPNSVTPGRSAAAVGAPVAGSSSLRRNRAWAKSAEPRAGRLSKDDF